LKEANLGMRRMECILNLAVTSFTRNRKTIFLSNNLIFDTWFSGIFLLILFRFLAQLHVPYLRASERTQVYENGESLHITG